MSKLILTVLVIYLVVFVCIFGEINSGTDLIAFLVTGAAFTSLVFITCLLFLLLVDTRGEFSSPVQAFYYMASKIFSGLMLIAASIGLLLPGAAVWQGWWGLNLVVAATLIWSGFVLTFEGFTRSPLRR